jgi:hypothetical protein
LPLVKERIELLLISTKHLRGDTIDVDEGNLDKYKFITFALLKKFTPFIGVDAKTINRTSYESTVISILGDHRVDSDIENANFDGILDLLNELLDEGEELLRALLVWEADALKTNNDQLLSKHSLDNHISRGFLKFGFDYSNSGVGNAIKAFFRENNFVKVCPYCNITETEYYALDGRAATTHQLDHFFDKDRFPLLACSFFNLIPSDSTCNGSDNKGTIEFTDEYHLNPYIAGFGKNVLFEPVLNKEKVTAIRLNIPVAKGTALRRQLLGITEEITETNKGDNEHKKGNVNVFMINTKYNRRLDEAQDVLNDIYKVDNGMRSIQKLLEKIHVLNMGEAYEEWYRSSIKTPFEGKKFSDRPFSKFNRDIHDFYYHEDTKPRNNFIRELINRDMQDD